MQAARTSSGRDTPVTAAADRTFTVAVIDDQFTGREIISAIVTSADPTVRVEKFADPAEAIDWVASHTVDIVFTDFRMPKLSGSETVRAVRAFPHCADIPIVVVTALDGRNVCYEALEAGATEFLNKPIDRHECLMRFRNLMTLRRQQTALADRASSLAAQIDVATSQIREREREALILLGRAGEFRDAETGNHLLRVARLSVLIARGLGMSAEQCDEIELAALLHDIGKIGIPDHLLRRPGPLNEAEVEIVRAHARIGHDILSKSSSKYLVTGATIALTHHERFDGSGYPRGIRGEDIPLCGRIVAVADALETLTATRPYKGPVPLERALESIRAESGKQFDPSCVAALLSNLEEARRALLELADPPAKRTT